MDYTITRQPKVLAFQLCQKLSHRYNNLQKTQTFFLLILLSLFSFYFFTSNPLNFIWVFALFSTLAISLTFALPNSRFSHAKSHPIQITTVNKSIQNASQSVVWSIGYDQKLEKVEKSGFLIKGCSNGDLYEGEIYRGKCSGSGVYHYYKCGRYEGNWSNGKYEGYGVETWGRGSKYRGQYRNGLRHGLGVYKFYDEVRNFGHGDVYRGDVYEGEWLNGQCHGCGLHETFEDGSRYVGEFKLGLKHGFGHYHYRNGDVYAGEYFADKMHGFGVYKFGNGHQYEGSWHEGRRQGFGVYSFRNGEVQFGYWQNGIIDDNASNRNGLSVSPFRSYYCQASDVVQKAREASERAYNVAIADDRVSKAVTAANRAANAARVAAVKAVQKRMHQELINKNTSSGLPGV